MNNSKNQLAVVGDVHGDHTRLARMLRILKKRNRRVIFLGDYVNRGPDTKRVIDALIEFQTANPDTVFLVGNHEIMLKQFLEKGAFVPFASSGGLATIRSYIRGTIERNVSAHLRRSLPHSHYRFLENCQIFWENERFLISHCGIDPKAPTERDIERMAAQSHPELFSERHQLAKTIIVGHYTQSSGKPFVRNDLICLDTGCGTNRGPLTTVLLPETEFISV